MSKQKIIYHRDGYVSIFEKGFRKSSDKYMPGLYKVSTNQHMELVISYTSNVDCQTPIMTKELSNFEQYLDLYLQNKDKFIDYNIIRKLGLLLHGEPGTMKTSFCKYITNKLIKNNEAIIVQGSSFYSIRLFYNYVRANQDTIVVVMIDELDSFLDLFGDRDLLEFMDGVEPIDNVLFLATTNKLNEIPDCFLRPSRYKFVIQCLPIANANDSKVLLGNMGLSADFVDPKDLVGKNIDEASEVIKDYILGFGKLKKSKNKIGFNND